MSTISTNELNLDLESENKQVNRDCDTYSNINNCQQINQNKQHHQKSLHRQYATESFFSRKWISYPKRAKIHKINSTTSILSKASTSDSSLTDDNNNNNNNPINNSPSHYDFQEYNSTDNLKEQDQDRGYAWVILGVMFLINASTLGSYRAYCLIFERQARSGEHSRADASLPFTIMGAVENMAGPIAGYLASRYTCRATICAGSCLITLAHVLAAFLSSSKLAQIISMGLVNGFGLSLVSISAFQVNNAYFVKYRSTAFGFSLSGAVLGSLYISPSCQFMLNKFQNDSTKACYLLMSVFIAPNILLSLLIKPKKSSIISTKPIATSNKQCTCSAFAKHRVFATRASKNSTTSLDSGITINTIDSSLSNSTTTTTNTITPKLTYNSCGKDCDLEDEEDEENAFDSLVIEPNKQVKLWPSVVKVLRKPMFHLIWPMQLVYCWLNFVYGTIIVDLGRDKGLKSDVAGYLSMCWACGQLVGRVALSSLVDKSSVIGAENSGNKLSKLLPLKRLTALSMTILATLTCAISAVEPFSSYASVLVSSLTFALSIFIANQYILFNGLVATYLPNNMQTMAVGLSSFVGSFMLLPRAFVIGYYRDSVGTYDSMLTIFSFVLALTALVWLTFPKLFKLCKKRRQKQVEKQISIATSKTACSEND